MNQQRLCPKCSLPPPRGFSGDCCPWCGANLTLTLPRRSLFSALVPALSGFTGGLALTCNALLVASPAGLTSTQFWSLTLASGLVLAALLVWLSWHLLPTVSRYFVSFLVALWAASFIVIAAGSLRSVPGMVSVWVQPYTLLLALPVLTAAAYLGLRRLLP